MRVRRSRRARRLRLWAPPRRPLELVVPWRVSAAAVEAFLQQSTPWIAARAEEAAGPGALGLARPGVAWLDGEALPLRVRDAAPGARATVALRGELLHLAAPGGAATPAGRDAALAALDRWYRREARARFEAAVEAVASEPPLAGVRPARIAIRDTTSRFGSCSTSGTVSFSWRLVLAPPPVLDYVVVHELCHLRHPNHGRGFWELVQHARPGWRMQRDWLNAHGRELLAWTPDLRTPAAAAAVAAAAEGGAPAPAAGPAHPAGLPGDRG